MKRYGLYIIVGDVRCKRDKFVGIGRNLVFVEVDRGIDCMAMCCVNYVRMFWIRLRFSN